MVLQAGRTPAGHGANPLVRQWYGITGRLVPGLVWVSESCTSIMWVLGRGFLRLSNLI